MKKAWLLLILACWLAPPLAAKCAESAASVPRLTAPELDRAIDDVISRPEYAWRMPRDRSAGTDEPPSVLSAFLQDVFDRMVEIAKRLLEWIEKFARWIRRTFRIEDRGNSEAGDWQRPIQTFFLVVLAVAASILGLVLYRIWKQRRRPAPAVAARGLPLRPDLLDESVSANELPSDEWMNMAREFMALGEYRLAVRAIFLSSLAHLARGEKLTLARHKSNREYIRELARRDRGAPEIVAAFAENVGVVEAVWYGLHPASLDTVNDVRRNHERIAHEPRDR